MEIQAYLRNRYYKMFIAFCHLENQRMPYLERIRIGGSKRLIAGRIIKKQLNAEKCING